MDCLFCRIVEKKIPADLVYETPSVVGFRDIHPQAPVHVLLVPRKHVAGVHEMSAEDRPGLMGNLIEAANEVACQMNVADRGYRLVINCKAEGGQTVDHLHLHLLGGRRMNWPPG